VTGIKVTSAVIMVGSIVFVAIAGFDVILGGHVIVDISKTLEILRTTV
jgi:hypothetical protein